MKPLPGNRTMRSPRPWLLYAQILLVIVFALSEFGMGNDPGALIITYLHFTSFFVLGVVTFLGGWRALHGQRDLSIYRNNRMLAWGSLVSGLLVGVMGLWVLLLILSSR